MDEENTKKSNSDLDRWEYILQEQSIIVRSTFSKNVDLEVEVEELRRELSVWKGAFKTVDDAHKTDKKVIARLERNIEAMKDDNPLLLCLIDGDGTIFCEDLWCMGQIGGRQAAMLLTKGITDHAASVDDGVTSRCQIWLSIFCNKTGLMDVLLRNGVCTAAQFDEFLQGFSQASPLFSVVDVGNGKEAADAKIKEYLRVFTRFPQTARVYFGGAHDNGYSSTLNFLENEGLLEKIVLLRGYRNLAFELKNIDLTHLEIEGLFMTQKLQTNPHWKNPNSTPPVHTVQLQDFDKFKNKSRTTSNERQAQSQPHTHTSAKVLDPAQSVYKQNMKPTPCTFFYLSHCRQGDRCRYGHDYILAPEHLQELHTNAKKSPCPHANKDQPCPDGDACLLGHSCPRLSKCGFVKSGKCKFIGKDMHKESSRATRRGGRKERLPLASQASVFASTDGGQFSSPGTSVFVGYMAIDEDSPSHSSGDSKPDTEADDAQFTYEWTI